jgi:hypothetical protein
MSAIQQVLLAGEGFFDTTVTIGTDIDTAGYSLVAPSYGSISNGSFRAHAIRRIDAKLDTGAGGFDLAFQIGTGSGLLVSYITKILVRDTTNVQRTFLSSGVSSFASGTSPLWVWGNGSSPVWSTSILGQTRLVRIV